MFCRFNYSLWTNKFRLRAFQASIYLLKVNKKAPLEQGVKYVNNKDNRTTLMGRSPRLRILYQKMNLGLVHTFSKFLLVILALLFMACLNFLDESSLVQQKSKAKLTWGIFCLPKKINLGCKNLGTEEFGMQIVQQLLQVNFFIYLARNISFGNKIFGWKTFLNACK